MKVGLAQINTTVGDLAGNCTKILGAYREAAGAGAEVVLTPELSITGYPPQDLVFKSRFVPLNLEMLARLQADVGATPLVVGFIDRNDGPGAPFRNGAAVLEKGRPIRKSYKSLLPTYDVFDEDRYFEPAADVETVDLAGRAAGLTICEDIWLPPFLPRRLYPRDPVRNLVARGAEIIFNISASPFHVGKPRRRLEMLSKLAAESGLPLVYCNALGGNDQLIFDGNSLAFDARGGCLAQLPAFQECVRVVDLEANTIEPAYQGEPEELYAALALGLRDYAGKCGFKSVVLGLSGGIDSAVTAVIAAEALGPEAVHGVTMPTQFSSEGSMEDSRLLARSLGIHFYNIPIQRSFEMFKEQFRELFAGLPEDTTEENIQPRLRAMTLMALSNKFGHLLLTTGNKSELAVGYCTIYGDMAGGLAVISDVPKTKIYELARWINREREIIPTNTVTKPPSAELKPNQRDQDTLPPYELLDEILQLYVEEAMTARDIIAHGYDERTVRWVARRVDLNEWKREQAAPGLRVTGKAFGLGRRMPLAQRFVD
ncbi:MAG: NAD+ synthase [Chthoniobacteraceae bacterium]|jgi:NAD+ synthetase